MKQSNQRKEVTIPQRYSITFKKYIVNKVERGELSKEQARSRYNIGGKTTVLQWCRKYGKLHKMGLKNEIRMMTEEDKTPMLLKRITELEKELEDSKLKVYALETMINIAESNYGLDIRKKHGAKQLKSYEQVYPKSP